jgi:glycine C-acetyltransferase
MYGKFQEYLQGQLGEIEAAGLTKLERMIFSPQDMVIEVADGRRVLNLCANNYLGLAEHPEIRAAAQFALEQWGYGMASVRFICGTQILHRELEQKLSTFLGMQDSILYSSCFDANGGLFESLLAAEDAVISDELNHASIIDGIRLCKAKRFRYKNNNLADLETQLREAVDCRFRMIATDGVFSMDGTIANLPGICELADKYDALVMVDDSHAVGFLGRHGRGTHEHHHVLDRIDIMTGTFGKALGGASGGYTAGRQEIVDILRQRSRPYLFSNSLAPPIVAATLRALEMLEATTELRDKLCANTQFFRQAISSLGLNIVPGTHPIVPILLGDARLASRMADQLLELGVYVIGFSFPVVPRGQARIRTQISAAHSREDLEFAVDCFRQVKQTLGI